MLSKDAYYTVNLLMRKYVKATKEYGTLLRKNRFYYTTLLGSYNFLALSLKNCEEFVWDSADELEIGNINLDVIGIDVGEVNYFDDTAFSYI